jgi:hypothetical protein
MQQEMAAYRLRRHRRPLAGGSDHYKEKVTRLFPFPERSIGTNLKLVQVRPLQKEKTFI